MRLLSIVAKGLAYTLLAAGCGGLAGGIIGGLVGVGLHDPLAHPERIAVVIVYAYLPVAFLFGIYGLAIGLFLGFSPAWVVGNLLWLVSALWPPLLRPWVWAVAGAAAGAAVDFSWPIGSRGTGTNADLVFPAAWIAGGAVAMFVFGSFVARLHIRQRAGVTD